MMPIKSGLVRTKRKGVGRLAIVAAVIAVVVIGSAAVVYYSGAGKGKQPLVIYTADAYVQEVASLYNGFSKDTGIPYATPKAGGSFLLARQIASGNPASVFISVSEAAITSAYMGNESAGWGIAFASDQMVIAYSNSTAGSQLSGVLASYRAAAQRNDTASWFSFFGNLTSGSVKVGISDPNSDPGGLRAWFALEAAGLEYANGNSSYFVNRMVENMGNVTSSSAADLVAPLQGGQIQLLFIYKSAAISHHLVWLSLSPLVNQGDPLLASFYSKLSYTTAAGVQKGTPIELYITVPADSTDGADSLKFTSYVLQNSAELASFGLTPISPAMLYNSTSVPPQVVQMIKSGILEEGGQL